jgi:hypothetical protein
MSEISAGGSEQDIMATAGRVILAAISFLAAVLVIAGLFYATGTSERHKAALAAAECEPNLSPSGLQCTTVQMLNGQYKAIVTPAILQLNIDEAAYTANEKRSLAIAEVALTSEMTSERALDARLASFPFPPGVSPVAKALIQANQARAKLTAEQARSSSLTQLRSFNLQVDVASAAVQKEMNLLRDALGSRPTADQEP